MPPKVKIVDRGWNKIKKNVFKIGSIGKAVSVGWQGSEAGIEHEGMTNVELASIMEFGTKDGTIPPRPMYRQTFDQMQQSYWGELGSITKKALGGQDVDGLLLLLGERFRSDIIRAVKGNQFKPWADSTREQKIAQGKGGDVPLWDTGQLMNATRAVVVKGNERK